MRWVDGFEVLKTHFILLEPRAKSGEKQSCRGRQRRDEKRPVKYVKKFGLKPESKQNAKKGFKMGGGGP